MKNPLNLYTGNFKPVFWSVVILLMLFASYRINIVDDAYISFRYARNLVEGHGLVFNPGERVEGYSNFLWVMLMAAGLKLGIPPEQFSIVLAFPIFLACLLLSFLIGRRVLRSRTRGLLLMALVGTNWTIVSFAFSGMETALQLLEFLAAAYIVLDGLERGWNRRRSLALSITLNIALLTRPDGVVLAVIALAAWHKTKQDFKLRDLFVIGIPFLLLFVPCYIWKVGYYHALLPNSFHAKVQGLNGLPYGLLLIYLYSITYLLFPHLVFLIIQGRDIFRKNAGVQFMGTLILVWALYVIAVGGDFMEFRFLVPVMPLLLVVILYSISTHALNRRLKYGLIICLFLGTVNDSLAFGRVIEGMGIQPVFELTALPKGPVTNCIGIGKKLDEFFGGSDVTIATAAAGAIPYYSKLKTVDMLGINDAMVPLIGEKLSPMPGHHKIAPLSYLVERRVNLIIAPKNFSVRVELLKDWIRHVTWKDLYHFYLDVNRAIDGMPMDEVTMLLIPVDDQLVTIAWYLTPCEEVERVIRENNLYSFRLTRPGYRTGDLRAGE